MGHVLLLSLLHGHQTSHVPSSSCPIKPCPSHHSFVLSCATTYLHSTLSPMQTTHLPLVAPPILTNHTPPANSPYRPPTLCVYVKPPTLHFPKPPWSCTCKTFSPFHSMSPSNCTWSNSPTYFHLLNMFATST